MEGVYSRLIEVRLASSVSFWAFTGWCFANLKTIKKAAIAAFFITVLLSFNKCLVNDDTANVFTSN